MSNSKRPARPSDPSAWRGQLIAELERLTRTASGSQLQLVQKMLALMGNAKPGGALDKQLFTDMKDAFTRCAQDPAAGAAPPVILECMEWMHVCFLGPPQPSTSGAKAAPVKSASPPKGGQKDGFDSGGQGGRSLTGETPVGGGLPQHKAQEQLESMKDALKTWQMNPGLGKLKG